MSSDDEEPMEISTKNAKEQELKRSHDLQVFIEEYMQLN
jgi:hypothetical protein